MDHTSHSCNYVFSVPVDVAHAQWLAHVRGGGAKRLLVALSEGAQGFQLRGMNVCILMTTT